MAMPGSPGAPAPVTVFALFTRLWAMWDRATGGGPCPNLPHASLPEPQHTQGLPTAYVVCRVPAGAAWLTICDKLPEADFDGLCSLWFLNTQNE